MSGAEKVFIQVDTTGLSSHHDRIVRICIVPEIGSSVVKLVNPGMKIPRESSRIHGITDDDVADAPSISDLREEIKSLLDGKIVVAYNTDFHLGFIPFECLSGIAGSGCAMARTSWASGTERFLKLSEAAELAGYRSTEDPDNKAKSCRAVWNFLNGIVVRRNFGDQEKPVYDNLISEERSIFDRDSTLLIESNARRRAAELAAAEEKEMREASAACTYRDDDIPY